MFIERIWAANPGRNYHYLVGCGETLEALVIDPLNVPAVLSRARELDWKIRQIFNTHEHADHTGGNAAVAAASGADILAHAAAVGRIGAVTRGLQDGDLVRVGRGAPLRCLDTPGHTRAHLCLYTEPQGDAPALFCGDTLFNAGAGNCLHGGDPELLYRSFTETLAGLPDDTRIYPGHDYLLRNLAFTLDREPGNVAARELAQHCADLDGDSMPILTLGEERRINVFLRLDSGEIRAELQRAGLVPDAGTATAREVFLALRQLRNRW